MFLESGIFPSPFYRESPVWIPAPGGGGTSYANTGGTGDRTAIITATTTASIRGETVDWLNGTYADRMFFDPAGQSGKEIVFDFGSGNAVVIDEAKWYQDAPSSHGDWKWQGSNDASAWTDIGSAFTLGGVTTQTQTSLSGNTTAWRYYRLLQTTGVVSDGPFIREIEFKISGL